MTTTRNYRELSRKRKIRGLTQKAWLIYVTPLIFSLVFEMIGVMLALAFVWYIFLFIVERYDEDIFDIFYIKLRKKIPKKTYC